MAECRHDSSAVNTSTCASNRQRVPDPAISVSQARENLLRKRNVSSVIDAARPQTNQIRAVFVYKMAGIYRLLVSAGFGNFLSVEVDNETVRYASFVRCSIIQSDARQERRLKPAAMLVGCFEIHVGWIAQFGMQRTDRLVRDTTVDPNVDRIVAFCCTGRKTKFLG